MKLRLQQEQSLNRKWERLVLTLTLTLYPHLVGELMPSAVSTVRKTMAPSARQYFLPPHDHRP